MILFSSYFLCCGFGLVAGLPHWEMAVPPGCGQRPCPECCETAAPWADVGGAFHGPIENEEVDQNRGTPKWMPYNGKPYF